MWLGLLLALGCGSCQPRSHRNPLPLPALLLWAWERPTDLQFLATDPRLSQAAIGVASLRATLLIHGAGIEVRSRKATLQLPPHIVQVPVVRVEAAADARFDAAQQTQLADALLQQAQTAALGRLQVDFEALVSQRPFYRALLSELRQRLGPTYPLSITALSSWCISDPWLRGLPVDEVVPMFYRLGPQSKLLRQRLAEGRDFAAECQHAHGLITDEPLVLPPTRRRIYVFSPQAFTADSVAAVQTQLSQSWK